MLHDVAAAPGDRPVGGICGCRVGRASLGSGSMQMDAIQRLRSLARDLQGRAADESEAAVGDSFDVRVTHTLDLIDHGEPAVALENLAQNVYEFHVHLSKNQYITFNEAGRALSLDARAWTFLAELVR
jgi:hypothetical protein